jgi:hypothetical protein
MTGFPRRPGWLVGLGLWALVQISPAAARNRGGEASRHGVSPGCISRLNHIYSMIKHYEHHSGTNTFPTLDDLAGTTRDKSAFLCPDIPPSNRRAGGTLRTSYMIVNNPREDRLAVVAPRDIAIVAEVSGRRDGTRLVLFYDGTVSVLGRPEFEALRRTGFTRSGEDVAPGR